MAEIAETTAEIDNAALGLVGVRITDSLGRVINRYVLTPGRYDLQGAWQSTDVTNQVQNVQDACAALWTPVVIQAYQTANPYVPVPLPSQAQQRAAKFLADTDLGDFRALIASAADPAALKAKVAALSAVQKQNLVLAFMLDYVASGRG